MYILNNYTSCFSRSYTLNRTGTKVGVQYSTRGVIVKRSILDLGRKTSLANCL